MSVLIESVTVVVPVQVLKDMYPGGPRAYLDASAGDTVPGRFAISDGVLTAVGFRLFEDAERHVAALRVHGIIPTDEEGVNALDVATVLQIDGPLLPASWLWAGPDPRGVMGARACYESERPLITPPGWTVEQHWLMARNFEDGRTDGVVPLGLDEHGVERWLDLSSGQELPGLPRRAPAACAPTPPSELPAHATRAMAAVDAALRDERRHWRAPLPHLRVGRIDAVLRYECRLEADLELPLLHLRMSIPILVPEPRRAALAEAIARANWGLRIGCFDMDHTDGELIYRAATLVGDRLDREAVMHLRIAGMAMCERYGPAFMRVALAGAEPGAEIAAAERSTDD